MTTQEALSHETPATATVQVALLPLTPSYDASNHGTYVTAIEDALSTKHNPPICNIALTGSYGVGKSSVLQRIAAGHQKSVVEISLSTLGLADMEKSDPAPEASVTTTNLIQKEIVKQLLYREDPSKMPGSRYRRIGRFNFQRGAARASLVGVVVVLLSFLIGWTAQLVSLLPQDVEIGLYSHLLIFVAATAFALAVGWLFHDRIHIEKLSAGAASIALSGASATYFDEYLDEIVYFFDVTRRDVVIFEDIDRFDDPHIFETLRSLNGLLNHAGQLKGRRIRFIYAIKDSIFDQLGIRAAREEGDVVAGKNMDAVDQEMARANRTKFFDLVIPVVPFITHRSARDLMDRVMKESGSDISSELIDLSARYLVDMRLVKNVRNEFVIFRERVLGGDGSQLGLSEDVLFAMMLYKSTHLTDFEDIKLGSSQIDDLYRDFRRLVTESMSGLASEETKLRRRLANLDSVGSRSETLGQDLINYIDQLQRLTGSVRQSLIYAQASIDAEVLKTQEFWKGLLSGDVAVQVSLRQQNGHIAVFNLTRPELEVALGKTLSPRDWEKSDRAQLRERLRKTREDRGFLRSADMHDLYDREEFGLVGAGDRAHTFRELAEMHLRSDLARQLLAAGYIDRNFTLYTSTYYANRVSSQATNFMIHSVDLDIMDPHFTLKADDVEAVLRERGESVLRQRGVYNINVLDHLLETKDQRVELLLKALKNKGDDERQFLTSYFADGSQVEALVTRLSADWPRIFTFVVEEVEVSDKERNRLLDVALRHITAETEYETDETIRQCFERVYADLAIITSDATTTERAELIAGLFEAAGVRFADLSHLAPRVRDAMVAANRYTITRQNLLLALDGPDSLALDAIKAMNDGVYTYAQDNLAGYLHALQSDDPSVTVEQPGAFLGILEDVAAHDESQLPSVIALAAPACRVSSLSDAPQSAWISLADGHRFPATFANVSAYADLSERIDEHIASLLKASGSIEDGEDASEPERVALAKQILAARAVLPEPSVRSDLVASLGLEGWLPLDAVPRESGDLIGLLIEAGVISDDADAFELAAGMDWKTREVTMSKSDEFVSYMTPLQVPAGDVLSLMRSEDVPEAIKDVVLARSTEFAADPDRPTLTALAQYALEERSRRVTPSELRRWALAKVDAELIIGLLSKLPSDLSGGELVPILRALGGDYAAVSARNGRRLRLANTESNLALVERLERLQIVSSHGALATSIAVNMRRPQ